VVRQGDKQGRIILGMPGRHNAINALAAVAVSLELGVDFDTIAKSLHGFKGVHRRFEIKGEAGGVTVVDDYGHHPSEIKATLAAARDWRPEKAAMIPSRVIAGFQPHRYTRTKLLADEFTTAFDQADVLLVAEIYAAGEDPIAGVTGKTLFKQVSKHRLGRGLETYFCPTLEEMDGCLEKLLRPGDLFLTVGAGNIWQVGEQVLKRLKREK
jgi:UDP-N-acetylmuramate--alanine ligase